MRFLKSIFCTVLITIAVVLVTIPVSATEYEDISEDYEQLLDGIPEDMADELPDGFFSQDIDEIHNAVSQISGFEYIVDTGMHILGL